MSSLPPVGASPILHFACGHCGVTLGVPASLAGVHGPCPGCGHTIAAPAPDTARPAMATVRATPPAPPAAPRDRVPIDRAPRSMPPDRSAPANSTAPVDDSLGKWSFAALGALLGGVAVFGSVWLWQLGRDLDGPSARTTSSGTPARAESDLDVLAEQRREAERETLALLAAQQTVWRFLRSPTPVQAVAWLDTPTAEPDLVAKAIVGSHLERGIRLERKRRLPDGAGYLSTWRVGEATQVGWLLQVNDCSGAPKIDWAALRTQLQTTGPAAVATSTPPATAD